MRTATKDSDNSQFVEELRSRRLWYHDIALPEGARTRFAEDYDTCPVLRGVDRGNRVLMEWMDERLPKDFDGLSVLDLGCADGLLTIWSALRGARSVLGVERNRYNRDRAAWLAQRLGLTNVSVEWGSVDDCLPAEPVDLVFCAGLIYHLVDPLGTLHRLRQRCMQNLILSSAIDLPSVDGSPMSRLDRYATGAHGVWSFNVPMVRQMLSTAGFEISDEHVDVSVDRGLYIAMAVPGKMTDHHIFEGTVDQEFPIDVGGRTARVRAVLKELADSVDGPIAVFGAGTHTPWLLSEIKRESRLTVACVMDDRIPPEAMVGGFPVRRPTDVDPSSLSTVVLSSWHQTEALRQRASTVFGHRVRVVAFYE